MSVTTPHLGWGSRPIIVVDADVVFRESLVTRLERRGLKVEAFASIVAANVRDSRRVEAACLLLDVNSLGLCHPESVNPHMGGRASTPIIFMSCSADIRIAVRAMKAGAIDFLCKPIADDSLFDAVAAAFASDEHLGSPFQVARVSERYDTLSARQKEVMTLVVKGLMNKQIAHCLGLSEITAKVHRSHLMHKMGARSVAELVHMAHALDAGPRGRSASGVPSVALT